METKRQDDFRVEIRMGKGKRTRMMVIPQTSFRGHLMSLCFLMPLHQTEWNEMNLFVITKVCMGSDLISLGDSEYMLSPDVDGL